MDGELPKELEVENKTTMEQLQQLLLPAVKSAGADTIFTTSFYNSQFV
jgi:hypothetical protein